MLFKFKWRKPKIIICIAHLKDILTTTARATPTAAGWVWWTWWRRGWWRWWRRRWWRRTGRGRRGRSTTAALPLSFFSSCINREHEYKDNKLYFVTERPAVSQSICLHEDTQHKRPFYWQSWPNNYLSRYTVHNASNKNSTADEPLH